MVTNHGQRTGTPGIGEALQFDRIIAREKAFGSRTPAFSWIPPFR
jgi:hypothetical protein